MTTTPAIFDIAVFDQTTFGHTPDIIPLGLVETSRITTAKDVMDYQERQIFGKVEITYTDPSVDENITFTATSNGVEDIAYNTWLVQTADNVMETKYRWFALAPGNGNKLDGTFYPMPTPTTGSVGWWSRSLSASHVTIYPVFEVNTVTITNGATGNTGVVWVYLDGSFGYSVDVTSGDTAEQVRDKIFDAGPQEDGDGDTWTPVKLGTDQLIYTCGTYAIKNVAMINGFDTGVTASVVKTITGEYVHGYAFEYPIVLQITFDVPRPMYNLKVVGDNVREEYPVAFGITCESYNYGGYIGWNTELQLDVYGNEFIYWTDVVGSEPVEGIFSGSGNLAMSEIKRLTLTITEWSHGDSQAKIAEFFSAYFEEYYGDDLISIKVLEETEPDSATIPMGNISSNEITVRFNNINRKFDPGNPTSPLYGMLTRNRRIRAWLGVQVSELYPVEYYPLGTFWSQDWSAPEGEGWAETTGWDKLESLRTSQYSTSAVYENLSLGAMAARVFEAGSVTIDQYSIHEDLYDIIIPYAWTDNISCREALSRIAAAASGRVYCDRDGLVVLEPYVVPETSEFEFTRDNFFSKDHPLAWTQIANYVEVHATPLIPTAAVEIYNDTTAFSVPAHTTPHQTVKKFCIFSQTPAFDVVTPITFTTDGGTISVDNISIYSWAAEITFLNTGVSAANVTSITIMGKNLVPAGISASIASDEVSIRTCGKCDGPVIESELIQTETQAQAIADALLASYKDPRRDLTLSARGSIMLRLGSRVTAPDYLDAELTDYTILRQDITWDGGLRVDVTARKIVEEE